jgi:hypothetical protein
MGKGGHCFGLRIQINIPVLKFCFNSVFEIKLQSHFDLCPPKSKYMISALLNILNINNLLISKNNLVVFRLKRIYDWQSDLK